MYVCVFLFTKETRAFSISFKIHMKSLMKHKLRRVCQLNFIHHSIVKLIKEKKSINLETVLHTNLNKQE